LIQSRLQSKLFLMMMALAIIPLLVFVGLTEYTQRQVLLQTAQQNLRALARFQSLQFDEFLREKKQLLHALSAKDIALTKQLNQAPPNRASLRSLLQQKQTRGKLSAIGFFRHNGRRIVSTGTTLPHKLAPLTQRGPHILGVVHFSKASETILRMAIPWRDRREPRTPETFLVVDFPFSLHVRFLQEKRAPAFKVNITLLDQQQRVVCGSIALSHTRHLFGKTHTLPSPFQTPHTGTALLPQRYKNQRGIMSLGMLIPLQETHWKLLVELSEEHALASLYTLRRHSLILIFGVMCFLILMVGLFSRQVVQPLRQLLAATQAFARGQFDATLPTPPHDEVGALIHAFEQMRTELRSYYTELEEKVEHRTHKLVEAQRFSELLFQAIPDVILVTDKALRVVKANKKAFELFGEDIIGRYCYHLFEGEGTEHTQCIAHQVLTKGQPISVEDDVPHPQLGELFYKDFYPIHNQHGEMIGVLESAKIITQRKMMMSQIIHREKIAAVGLMASGVAHEIGNPLASISALVQRLQRKGKDSPFSQTYDELYERCHYISGILETLSHYARKEPLQASPLDLHKEAERAMALVRFDKRLRRVQLDVAIQQTLPLLWGKDGTLSQVFTNLLINALDATEDVTSPQIELKAWPTRDGLRFSVRDNGHGFQEQDKDKLFEPFFTTKEANKGTGLGLAICKQIIEDLGGTIEVKHAAPQGAIFEVSLPLRQAPIHTTQPEDTQ